MTKIALPIAELKPALTGLSKILKEHSLPVLNNIKIERTKDGWIALTTTDLDAFATVRLEQPAEADPMSVLVPYAELQKAVKACTKNETITVHPTFKNTAALQYGIAEVEFESLPVSEFPEIPRISGEPIPINETLRNSIHDALKCASTDATRQIINSACIDVTNPKAQYVIGTNGRHLYASNSFTLPLKKSLIIPNHKFLDWPAFNADGEWQLKLGIAEKDKRAPFQITSRRWRFIGYPHEGNYPNWRQVIPAPGEAETSIELNEQTIENLPRTIQRMRCHDGINFTIGLEVKNGEFYLLGKAPNATDWTKAPIEDAKCTGKEVTVFLNRNYLTKPLQFGLSTIELIDSKAPIQFQSKGSRMVVMPIRPDVGNPSPTATATQPTALTPAAQPPTERNHMPAKNGNGSEQKLDDKPKLDKALDQIEAVKGSYREAIKGLNDLTDTLKLIQKEQKSTEKEVQSVRTTLEKLQSVRL